MFYTHDQLARALVFTKPAVAGRVKTRLAATLGAERAAALHAAFVRDVVRALAGGSFELAIAWALEADEAPPADLGAGLPWHRQAGGDLGARLFEGLRWAARSAAKVAAVGSDHPEIDAGQIEEAFRRLDAGADVAIGPVPDGGYFLLALRRDALSPRLFEDIAWSTDQVFATTQERCAELGLRLAVLPSGHDVDVESDLRQLLTRLDRRPARCPATRALLESWGMLAPVDGGLGMA